MKSWLFEPYDKQAYGLFRFSFYMTILFFYHKYHSLHILGWLNPEFREYFEPISFFKFLSFDDFQSFSQIDIFGLWKWAMLLSAFGILFPLTSMFSFIGILLSAGIMLNFGKVHHVNHMPVMILGILAFSFNPGGYSGDSFIAKLFKRRLPEPTAWALKTAQIYMCLVYFASGVQKLRNSGLDWIFSDNMQHIILTRPTITELGLWVAQYPLLCKTIALMTVTAELTAPIALFSKRYRWFVIPTLFMFHIGTYSVLGNHGYFIPYNLCYLVWLPWERILALSKDLFWLAGVRLFDFFPVLGKAVKFFYTKILFPAISTRLRSKYGDGFFLVLRHSILKKNFNPFLSDIDYTLVVKQGFQYQDDLLKDLISLNRFKIFDLPQVYLEDEWREIQNFDSEIQEKLQFIWNVRKIGWLQDQKVTSKYEQLKKTRAIEASEDYISKFIDHWGAGTENFPISDSSLPQVCLFIPFLEIKTSAREMVYDVNQLMFIISLLPGEENWVSLNSKCIDFKRKLWVHEYLLSRSHLRVYSRKNTEHLYYKVWLRDLERKYKQIFSQSLVAEGEEFDMDKK